MNQFEQSDSKQQCPLQHMFKKYEEATQRYLKGLEDKKSRAKQESEKAREAQFLQMLEAQNKKIEFDEKLQESQERKRDLEKHIQEKQLQKKQKDDEVRRKKKDIDDEKLQKWKVHLQKKEIQGKKVKKDVQKIKRKDELKILLDQSVSDAGSFEWEVEKRQCKSLSDSLLALESDQIVYFKLKKEKQVELKDEKKIQRKQNIMPSKTFREQSVPISKKQIFFPQLIRPRQQESLINLQQILQQPLSPTQKNEETSSTNVTPKKEKDEEPQFFRLCQICNIIIDNEDVDKHIQSKSHKSTKQYYGLSASQNDILQVKGSNDEISQNRFLSIRKRCQKIKQKISQKSLQLENINIYSYKEPGNSYNRQRIQKLSNDLDKLLNNQIKDLYLIEQHMKELLKLVNQETDLINLRQMKFIQIIIEVYKKVSGCHKSEYTSYLKIIGVATEIVYQFCSVYNNRTYILVSNKLMPIIDFMYSFLSSKPTKFIYSYSFVAQCFQIFSLLIKHRLPSDPLLESDLSIQEIQDDTLEYIYCCGLFNKMKLKFLSFEKDYINQEGKIPVALVKSVAFIEAATNYHGFDTYKKSLFEEEGMKVSKTFSEHLRFVIKETELFGLIQLISQMVVGEEICFTSNKLLPQTIISFFMVGIKTLNNIARLNLIVLQEIMHKTHNKQEVLMIMQRLVTYCKINHEQSQDLKDLLNELILLIGYYCVLNTTNQNSLVGSMKKISVLHNLLQMPSQYYVDKHLKSILFPTLLCCMFKNPNNMKIVLNEMDKSYFLELLQMDSEQFQETHGQQLQRSPSISSTNSQNSVFPYSSAVYFRLSQRFPIYCFKEAFSELVAFAD